MSINENIVYVLAMLCDMVILATHVGKTRLDGKIGFAILVMQFMSVIDT